MNKEVLSSTKAHYNLAPKMRVDPQPARRFFGLNVLLVDDDPADVSLILSALKRHPGVSIAHATDSPGFALRQLSSGQLAPDLILLDIHMPKLDGFEFLEDMREIPSMASTPVVFLTTSRLRKDVGHARHSSASLYIVKPDNYFDLQAQLNGVIRRAAHGAWRNN
jgi:CheY-like chemotaxis protein